MPAVQPPLPAKRPTPRTHHGDTFTDNWEWLRDPKDPEVLAHLAAENAWTAERTAHLKPLENELFEDVRARTQETDLSVPRFHRHGDEAWWYYRRTVEGRDYPVHCRVPATDPDTIPDPDADLAGEQVLLDENAEAEGQQFFSLGAFGVSPDGTLLAYSIDVAGDERYELRVRRIDSGEQIGAAIEQVGSGVCWAGNDTIVYSRVDDAWRPFQVWRHALTHDPADDVLMLAEDDDMFWLGVDESRDRQWLILAAGSKLTTEIWLVPTADPTAAPRTVAGRTPGLEYIVEPAANELFIVHNADSPDFAVSRAPLDAAPGTEPLAPLETWRTFAGPTSGVRYTDVHAYAEHVVIGRRRDGLTGVEVHTLGSDDSPIDPAPIDVAFAEPVHTVYAQGAEDYDTDRVRLLYTSLVTPPSVLSLDLATGDLTTLRTTPVLDHPQHGAYSPENYVSERIWATADDGTRVPISLVRRRDTPVDRTAPALLYGYGSYEISIDPTFSMMRLSLLDRGFVYAIAHIRGGGELGRAWYENGKMLHKRNTFTDFIAAARHLVAAGYTSVDRLAAQGGSAGGLLMGAVANLAPDAFRAIHASVPFVDALTTILDPELPLTVTEWEEWGDPLHDPTVYAYMKSYSPYENVSAQAYPAILATTSLNDTRVFFVEPAKWIAALRERATNGPERPILFRCEMVAGHGGVSGRYNSWREAAFEYAWLIDQVT